VRITWDEALDTVAERLRVFARDHGPESVVFGSTSPSTSAMSDAVDSVQRLQRALGAPNMCTYMELCGWGRYQALRSSVCDIFRLTVPAPREHGIRMTHDPARDRVRDAV
jgi:anaerobic selenocysteine-containing dehydrogenase